MINRRLRPERSDSEGASGPPGLVAAHGGALRGRAPGGGCGGARGRRGGRSASVAGLGAGGGKRAGSRADGRGLELGRAPAGGCWETPAPTPAGNSKAPSARPRLPGPGVPHLGDPTCRPAAWAPHSGSLTSRELRPEPCGGAGPPARKGVCIRARPRSATLSPGPRAETRRGADAKMAAAGTRAGEGRAARGPDPQAPAPGQSPPGPGPGTGRLVGKTQAGDGSSRGPAQSWHLSADLLSFLTCHGPLTF
ncbi:translation initiation factor IF-2-like [Cervus canadensis]|uniref:translation initiation factor IF-2-like n=1 Tax=Cervus canadensis TaxID=1574408 RepID=UPI001C9E4119|nr:translation initiation factor IF-2-like [Cervus canadensis]